MPKRGAIALLLTAGALALLLNFQTPIEVAPPGRTETGSDALRAASSPAAGAAATPAPTRGTAGTGAGSGSSGSTGSSGSGGTSGSAGTTTTDPTGTRTVTGPAIQTRWGPVQVEVTLADGKITDITALQLPVGGRSGQISDYAEPILRSQALQAQGASIDGVSGATYTSDGYARSLQAALDQAGA